MLLFYIYLDFLYYQGCYNILVFMRLSFLFIILSFIFSCSVKNITYSGTQINPKEDFDSLVNNYPLDYSEIKNWSFRSDVHDDLTLLPSNYNSKNDYNFDVSVFYIHPTTLYNSNYWNADTSHFRENYAINLCLENQASVFAGLTHLYAPHYREMHIYSYTDTVNGYKAYDFAFNDILNAFNFFINHISTDKYIIASHSQGTNHAIRLINEYISKDTLLLNRLLISYLIGMDVNKNNMSIPVCNSEDDINCFLTWRSFRESFYPKKWKFGKNIYSVNPINFKTDSIFSNKKDHLGILLPNKKILFKKSISVRNESGLLWVRFNNIFLNKYRSDSYHKADFNLFWLNIRNNLKYRLSKIY